MRLFLLAAALLGASTAQAACPANPAITERAAALIDDLRASKSELEAQGPSSALWDLWLQAPDDTAQGLLDRGLFWLRLQDYEAAETSFDALISYCPDYAEGYNQRAFAAFLQKDFGRALSDLDRALERSPAHVAALAGKALTLFGLERDEEAQAVLRDALALNPWLSERRLLQENGDPL
ncbi:MAG: tetratricopeptide repeat protein [Pseudomonadota bacterium]